jgi:hypothetical protein
MSDKHDDAGRDLEQRIDAIESGYEFLLAYAAQGRDTDRGPGSGRQLRDYLEGMQAALDGLGHVARAHVAVKGGAAAAVGEPFLDALERDASTARAAMSLVLLKQDISSQLIDNLNASIHLRALLTDLFIVDEWLKTRAGTDK